MNNVQKITETITKDGDLGVERVREEVNTDWEKGTKSWNDVTAQGKEAVGELQIRAKNAWETSREFMQNHPETSVGIALVAGAAIGALALLVFRRHD